MIGLCDQAIMGHLSITSFACAGIVSGFINSITGVLGMISVSFNILGVRAKADRSLLQNHLDTQIF